MNNWVFGFFGDSERRLGMTERDRLRKGKNVFARERIEVDEEVVVDCLCFEGFLLGFCGLGEMRRENGCR